MTKMHTKPLKSSHGFSLIEILLVIGVIAVLALAAFVIYPKVRTSLEAGRETGNIRAVTAGIKQVYLVRDYGGINNANVNQARVFPRLMNDNSYAATQSITHGWGGPVTVAPGTRAERTTFTINYVDVPSAGCVALVQGLAEIYEHVAVDGLVIKSNLDQPKIEYEATVMVEICNSSPNVLVTLETF